MKEKIAEIILGYQNEIKEYFETEIPMEDDADNMDSYLEHMKQEILALFE